MVPMFWSVFPWELFGSGFIPDEYPDNIAGMVFVDHAFEPIGNTAPTRSSNPGSSHSGYSTPVLISKAPIAIGFEDDSNFTRLPERDQELHSWALSRHPIRVDHEMFVDCLSRIKNITHADKHIRLETSIWQ